MTRLRSGDWLHALGVSASVIVAVLLNVLAARHYLRWDFTRDQLYTLSPATLQTLHDLPERVQIEVLLSKDDPLAGSLQFLLRAYLAETNRLDVHSTDPDRQPAEFLAIQQKYGIEAGKTDEGQIVTDAVVVMSRAQSKPFFLGPSDLLDVRQGQQPEPRSKMEQSLTLTLRKVLRDERPHICFTTGHGELRVGDAGPRGLGELASKLKKNNYDVHELEHAFTSREADEIGCSLTVIAGPTRPFAADEARALQDWFERGGNLLIATGPVFDPDHDRAIDLGLDPLLRAAGISLDDDFVFETEPRRKLPGGPGDQFLAEAKPHELTQGLVGEQNRDLKILVKSARSLRLVAGAVAIPTDLLSTSADAFGVRSFFSWAKGASARPPRRAPQDLGGPLCIAMASELAPAPPARSATARRADSHGPRMVVLGAANLLFAQNWQEPVLRGGAIFVESALSWLAAQPVIVDVPDKPAFAGARIDEASLGQIYRYVVLYLPAAVALLGIAVYVRRRATEGRAGGPRLEGRG